MDSALGICAARAAAAARGPVNPGRLPRTAYLLGAWRSVAFVLYNCFIAAGINTMICRRD